MYKIRVEIYEEEKLTEIFEMTDVKQLKHLPKHLKRLTLHADIGVKHGPS